MKFQLYAVIAGAWMMVGGLVPTVSAQNREVTPEMIRQAQAAGYNPDLRQGLEGLDVEKLQGAVSSSSSSQLSLIHI